MKKWLLTLTSILILGIALCTLPFLLNYQEFKILFTNSFATLDFENSNEINSYIVDSKSNENVEVITYNFDEKIKTIKANLNNANITIIKDENATENTLNIVVNDSKCSFDYEYEKNTLNVQEEYFYSIDLNFGNNNTNQIFIILKDEINLDKLDIESENSNLNVENILASDLSVTLKNGDFNCYNSEIKNINATNQNGDIFFEGNALNLATFSTDNGKIETIFDNTKELLASSTNGEIKINANILGQTELKSDNGSIDINIENSLTGNFHAISKNGKIYFKIKDNINNYDLLAESKDSKVYVNDKKASSVYNLSNNGDFTITLTSSDKIEIN